MQYWMQKIVNNLFKDCSSFDKISTKVRTHAASLPSALHGADLETSPAGIESGQHIGVRPLPPKRFEVPGFGGTYLLKFLASSLSDSLKYSHIDITPV